MIPEWLQPIAFVAGWFVLMRWILPAVGIPTCMSGACKIEPRKPSVKDPAGEDIKPV